MVEVKEPMVAFLARELGPPAECEVPGPQAFDLGLELLAGIKACLASR
jgi:hypothetical protein